MNEQEKIVFTGLQDMYNNLCLRGIILDEHIMQAKAEADAATKKVEEFIKLRQTVGSSITKIKDNMGRMGEV